MVVKFRRIEDRRQSVVQLRRRTEERRERRRVLPKLIMATVAVALGLGAYLYYKPSRVVAPALVHAEAVEVSSPLAGTLQWILPDAVKDVTSGRQVARLLPDPKPDDAAVARLNDLRLRATAATGRIEEEKRAVAALRARLAEEEAALKANIDRLEQKLATRREEARAARDKIPEATAAMQQADRLRRLEALTGADHAAVKETLSAALQATREAVARLEATDGELESAQQALEAFGLRRQREIERAEARVGAARRDAEQAEQAITAHREHMARRREAIVVTAPLAGVVAHRHATRGEHLAPDEPLLTLYAADTKGIRAFVAPQERDILKPGKPVRVYLPGREDALPGRVARAHEQVTPLPPELRAVAQNGPSHGVPADIRLDGGAVGELLPGEVCKVVFDK